MHELLHFIGICSDSKAHLNLIAMLNEPELTKQASILVKYTCTKACCKVKNIASKQLKLRSH